MIRILIIALITMIIPTITNTHASILLTLMNNTRTMVNSCVSDSLQGSSAKLGAIQRIFAWPLHKDDTHKSRSVNM